MNKRRSAIGAPVAALISSCLLVACGGSRGESNPKTEASGGADSSASPSTLVDDGTTSDGGAGNTSDVAGSGGTTEQTGAAGGASSTVPVTGTPTVPVTGTPTVTVSVQSATKFQTLEGFGAAVAWYQDALAAHTKKAEIYKLAFADMGLDILRFRNTYQHTTGSSVTAEKAILDQATASLGRRPKVLLTSWSPPSTLKANGKESCTGEATCTLKMVNGQYVYAEFAAYWVDSIAAYRAAGIAPDFISIQNEPDFIPGSWEGCKFEATETTSFPGYGKALTAVHSKVSALSEPPKIIGPEILGVHYNKMPKYMAQIDPSQLHAVAHHLYEMGNDGVWDWRDPGPDSYIAPMLTASSAAAGLPVFQTEFQTDADNGIEGGFETAWLLHNSLVEENVSAWLYWDLVWDKSGLIALNGANYTVRDQYYSMRHYARFTDPGYVRVGASSTTPNVRVSAFLSADQSKLTLVVLNVGTNEEKVALDFGAFNPVSSEVYRTTYRPGSSETWAAQPSVVSGLLTMPSRSVATIALSK